MANVDRPNGFRAIAPAGQTIPMYSYVVKDAVPLKPGDAVIIGTDGKIDIAMATSAAIFGVCQSVIVGTTGTVYTAMVVPALPNIVFSAQCSGDPSAKFGLLADLEGATGIMEVNEDASSTDIFRIVGLEQSDGNTAAANARVLVTIHNSQYL